jgi:hypothetical protein
VALWGNGNLCFLYPSGAYDGYPFNTIADVHHGKANMLLYDLSVRKVARTDSIYYLTNWPGPWSRTAND